MFNKYNWQSLFDMAPLLTCVLYPITVIYSTALIMTSVPDTTNTSVLMVMETVI